MRPASCEPIRVLAALAADDELSETEQRRLATHLAVCGDCRAFSVAVGALTATVRETPSEVGPQVKPFLGERPARRPRRHRHVARPVMKLSAVAASVAAAAVIGRATTEPPPAPTSVPVILIDEAQASDDSHLALVARDYARDRARYGGDPPSSTAPGVRAD